MLTVAPATFAAARYAVHRWHYSKTMPLGALVKHGVWEEETFVGVIIYGRGANTNLGGPYGLDQTECCELVRVALDDHEAPVSAMLSRSLRLLRLSNPGLRLVVSFADPNEGHHGGIYQAGAWLYTGESEEIREVLWAGKWCHNRLLSVSGFSKRRGQVDVLASLPREIQDRLPSRIRRGKYRYLMPLDRPMRRQVGPLALPYPRGQGLKG